MEIGFVVAGLAVGFVVGLTGVGGGSLMTPILLWFGIPPSTAVGTDLLYAALTKAGGVAVHHRRGHVDWRLVGWLAAGSVPASLLTLGLISHIGPSHALDGLFRFMLGVALILTAAAILGKPWLLRHVPTRWRDAPFATMRPALWVTGAVLEMGVGAIVLESGCTGGERVAQRVQHLHRVTGGHAHPVGHVFGHGGKVEAGHRGHHDGCTAQPAPAPARQGRWG